MKTILRTLAIITALSCGAYAQFSFDGGKMPSARDIEVPQVSGPASAAAATPAVQPKEWTVMVMLAGQNDLASNAVIDLNEMETVGSSDKVNIVAEIGLGNAGSARLLVYKDADTKKVSSPLISIDKTADTGDYRRVIDFAKWAKQTYPAKHYLFVMWNHGSGVNDPLDPPGRKTKGINFNYNNGNYVRNPQLAKIMAEAGPVDILAFDACLMQMAEIAFEVKDYARYIVASEEVVPVAGFPYDAFLKSLNDNPAMDAAQLSRAIVASFKDYYSKTGDGVQLSAIRADKVAGLGSLMADFAAAAREANDTAALGAGIKGVIRYQIKRPLQISYSGDVGHFAGLTAAGAGDKLKEKGAALKRYITDELVLANAELGKNQLGQEYTLSTGIAVYLPPFTKISRENVEEMFETKYDGTSLAFNRAVAWNDFLPLLYNSR